MDSRNNSSSPQQSIVFKRANLQIVIVIIHLHTHCHCHCILSSIAYILTHPPWYFKYSQGFQPFEIQRQGRPLGTSASAARSDARTICPMIGQGHHRFLALRRAWPQKQLDPGFAPPQAEHHGEGLNNDVRDPKSAPVPPHVVPRMPYVVEPLSWPQPSTTSQTQDTINKSKEVE